MNCPRLDETKSWGTHADDWLARRIVSVARSGSADTYDADGAILGRVVNVASECAQPVQRLVFSVAFNEPNEKSAQLRRGEEPLARVHGLARLEVQQHARLDAVIREKLVLFLAVAEDLRPLRGWWLHVNRRKRVAVCNPERKKKSLIIIIIVRRNKKIWVHESENVWHKNRGGQLCARKTLLKQSGVPE